MKGKFGVWITAKPKKEWENMPIIHAALLLLTITMKRGKTLIFLEVSVK